MDEAIFAAIGTVAALAWSYVYGSRLAARAVDEAGAGP
jgi:hypothetical protein